MSTKRRATKKEKIHSYVVMFEPLAEGGYNVVVPAISEICTFGKTLAEAKRMATDAIQCFLESTIEDQLTPPRDVRLPPQITTLKVKLELA